MAAYEILVVLAGLTVGWLRKGSLWNVTSVRLRFVWLLPVAYLLQHFSIYDMRGVDYQISIVLSYIGLIVFCVLNLRTPGLKWALTGTMANFLVMLANGLRMPAYLPIIRAVNPKLIPLLIEGKVGKSIAMTSHTHLNFLGDIFPFRVWPESMISIGDVLFGIGFILIIQHAMMPSRREPLDEQQHRRDQAVRAH